MGHFIKVVAASEVADNSSKVVDLAGRPIAVFKVNGQYCAIDNTCPHRGGPLGEGEVKGTIVTCPWHGWEFDVITGVSPVNPAAKVKSFPCREEGGDVWIDLA